MPDPETCRYVKRNPLRARLVRRAEAWRWEASCSASTQTPILSAVASAALIERSTSAARPPTAVTPIKRAAERADAGAQELRLATWYRKRFDPRTDR